jgi:GDP/UDP-N,N'-diacetylbacillosamine 2-epimerase (hydrolysing)
MKKIAFATTARSDYNASRYIIKAIENDLDLELQLLVGGSHVSHNLGYTVEEIVKDGYTGKYSGMICGNESKDIAYGIYNSIGIVTDIFENDKPDLLIINGDRLELMSFIIPAVLYNIPIAHIGGGEITEGSRDNDTRYAISHYAHLHFVADQQCAENLYKQGIEKRRVFIVGWEGIENIRKTKQISNQKMKKRSGIDLSIPSILFIYYPSLENGLDTQKQIDLILNALDNLNLQIQIIFIYPCAEIEGDIIKKAINNYIDKRANCKAFSNLDNEVFVNLMRNCKFIIGNSSAGIIEMPSIPKWTINIGNRQKGRKHNIKSIINVGYSSRKITEAMDFALNNKVPENINQNFNPSQKIIQAIKENIDRPDLFYKKFLLGGNQ